MTTRDVMTRRSFLERALITAGAVALNVQEAVAEKPAGSLKPLSQAQLKRLASYDGIIDRHLEYFNAKHSRTPEKNLIKAMMAVESLTTPDAFAHDPMQIANQGDYALSVLQSGKENTPLIGDFSRLNGIKHTPRRNGRWDYSNSKMTPDLSIYGGIGWLMRKSAVFGVEDGKIYIKDWKDWLTAAKLYNGGGDPGYMQKVTARKSQLDNS